MHTIALLLVLTPFVSAPFAYALGLLNKKFAFWVAEIAMLFVFGLVLYLFMHFNTPIIIEVPWFSFGTVHIPIGIAIDRLSMVMLLIVSALGFLDMHFSHDYMGADENQPRYYALMLFFIGGMILLVSAKELSGLFVGWELMGLASYLLISFWHTQKAPADAGVSAFLYTKFGDVFLFAALGLLYHYTGTLDLATINRLALGGGINVHVGYVIALFIFIAAIGKSGQFPLFPWLMRAMEGPTTVSALIHGATMVNSGIYIVARLFDFYTAANALIVVASVAALSAFVGASSALVQKEMKKVLAYSTMSHLALAFVGLGVGSLAAGMLHLVNHAVFKALLFLGSGAVILVAHHTKEMDKLGGLAKKLPLIALFMGVGALSLSGVPPLSGFYSKDAIFATSITNPQTQGIIAVLTVIAGLLSMAYIGRLWFLLFGGKPRDEELFESIRPPSRFWIVLPLGIMATATFVLGFFQENIVHFFTGKAWHEAHVAGMLPLLIIALILLFGTVYYFYNRRLDLTAKLAAQPLMQTLHRVLFNGYYVEAMIHWFVGNIVLGFIAKGIHFIDRYIIDAFVNGSVAAARFSASQLKKTDTGKSGDYAGFMVIALGVLVFVVLLGGIL
jgi:NADH-quinone oxidoreductase subunit L